MYGFGLSVFVLGDITHANYRHQNPLERNVIKFLIKCSTNSHLVRFWCFGIKMHGEFVTLQIVFIIYLYLYHYTSRVLYSSTVTQVEKAYPNSVFWIYGKILCNFISFPYCAPKLHLFVTVFKQQLKVLNCIWYSFMWLNHNKPFCIKIL